MSLFTMSLEDSAKRTGHPPLYVFAPSDRFQMVRIDTATNTAKMVQFESLRYWAYVSLKRDYMRKSQSAVEPHATITILQKRAHPNNTATLRNGHAVVGQLIRYRAALVCEICSTCFRHLTLLKSLCSGLHSNDYCRAARPLNFNLLVLPVQ